jgi:hypothetical protein
MHSYNLLLLKNMKGTYYSTQHTRENANLNLFVRHFYLIYYNFCLDCDLNNATTTK